MSPLFSRSYKVRLDNEDWVAPEETLVDSSSRYADVEVPISGLTFRVVLLVFVVVILFIAGFVFDFSILNNEYFAKLALQNKSENFPISPPRGIIFDRNGTPLVVNVPDFDILIISRELRGNEDLGAILFKVGEILGQDSEVFSRDILDKAEGNALFFAALDVSKDQALSLELLNVGGLYVVSNTKREYQNSRVFSSILGYTGSVHQQDLEGDDYYFPTDIIGRLGIEAQYENILRGEHGNIYFVLESEGSVDRQPEAGDGLVLTIDADIQSHLHDSVRTVLAEAGLLRGAAIIQNPKDGSVLAMVSFPTYDSNVFSGPLSAQDVETIFDSKSRPLFNRAISGLYNPGSTIKPFIGMTALEEGLITPRTTITDCISISVGDSIFRNWREESGVFDLKKAIANSCNVFFYSIGGGYGSIRGLGITRISDYLMRGFAGSRLGIDLPGESVGFVPTPDWKEAKKGEPWYLGDTYNVSIGQGDLLVSPLWLNGYVSAIANGGTFWKPRVVLRSTDDAGKTIEAFDPQENGKLPFSTWVINEMKENMKETTVSGTARVLASLPVAIAAKTGTAEVIKGKTINALFTAFAPADNPELAMTILIEGSEENQGYSIRAANSFLHWYFVERLEQKREADGKVEDGGEISIPETGNRLIDSEF